MFEFFLSSGTLLHREIVRFLRQRSRVVGALGTPLVFWFLIGSGLGKSFRNIGASYLEAGTSNQNYLVYFFPGTVVLILLFTAIFSTISIIEDRHEGFLQGVLVAPVSRGSIVLGKLMGGTVLAMGQGLIFLALAPLLQISITLKSFLYIFSIMGFMSFGLTGLGFVLAWRLDSTQGFHAVMNLFLLPLWFLSGALFPISGAPPWLQTIMKLNPLTYSLSGLENGLFYGVQSIPGGPPTPAFCMGITIGFSILMFAASVAVARKK